MKIVITDPRKVSQFSSILKNLKNFSQDIEIHIDENRLYAQGMDSSHCCLFELELLSEWFTKYENNGGIRLGVNCEMIAKIFNMLGENQSIEMYYERGADSLYITLSPNVGETGIVREFKLPLMDLQSELMEIPETEYAADIEMVSNDFTELVTQLNTFGSELRIQCEDEIRLTGKGEMGSMDAVIKEDDILMYAIEEDAEIQLSFSLLYFHKMCLFRKLAPSLSLHLSSDETRVQVVYRLDDTTSDNTEIEDCKSYLRFFLAAKVESD